MHLYLFTYPLEIGLHLFNVSGSDLVEDPRETYWVSVFTMCVLDEVVTKLIIAGKLGINSYTSKVHLFQYHTSVKFPVENMNYEFELGTNIFLKIIIKGVLTLYMFNKLKM